MVKTGLVATIRHMTYQPVGRGASSVEVMTFRRLRDINDRGAQRADFHVLALVDEGDGTVAVDFASHPLSARTAVLIPHGAVHRWDDITRITGHLVLFVPTAPVTHHTRAMVASPGPVARWTVPAEAWPFVDAARGHLVLEAAALAEDPSTELPAILLSALITRLDPPYSEARSANPTFQLFRSSVEAHFRTHHDAGHYAAALGFAPRTLTRAVQQATGRTAKAYIVERIALEAKRLLAHERVTAARCASELGFPDPSNFSLFFLNATGLRPGAWQAATTLG
ncbi:helix-turn-helix domain-containing protein [Kitasatospora cineracea]|uniref:Transcriptional regulator n=1 Tax=Kitasatospora cineracea TaxID=88074 RepID=A0A8G1UEP5_9ACTN|nr:helix-turn-helix domain-containing protein [Kitasatospora cineracea]ROR35876.1 transcriptional regulator [Kitasatospora cineracea]